MDNEIITLINTLYGNQEKEVAHLSKGVNNIPSIMGTAPRNRKELSDIKHNGYNPIKAAEVDSHRFGYHDLGTPENAIVNAKSDIKDIKQSKTAKSSNNYQADIKFDQKQIKKDQTFSKDTLVMISQFNNSQILRPAEATDVEMIYHNTHYSGNEINQRHPDQLFYTKRDAEMDAKRDLN